MVPHGAVVVGLRAEPRPLLPYDTTADATISPPHCILEDERDEKVHLLLLRALRGDSIDGTLPLGAGDVARLEGVKLFQRDALKC